MKLSGWLRLLIPVLFMFVFLPSVFAQDQLFWDYPEIIGPSDGRFPQNIVVGDGIAVVWQDFDGEKGSLEATTSIKALFSPDGMDWSSPVVNIATDLPYLWLEEVPLFSAASGKDGRLVVAVSRGLEGVAIYRQNGIGSNAFSQEELLVSTTEAADTAVAPRLSVGGDGSYVLFLTRRTSVEGASRPTTLTIFSSYSEDGRSWSSPELFVDPVSDRGAVDATGSGAVLEQNFLPHMLNVSDRDYVAFQTLRQGSEGQVYQIYVKTRRSGGDWDPAIPITELLKTESPIDDPLLWDNQRPNLGLTAANEILLTFERRQGQDRPGIAAVPLGTDGRPLGAQVENVVSDRFTSSFPQTVILNDSTWIVWFDDSGIRMAQRNAAFTYLVDFTNPDAQTPGAERGSVSFPKATVFNGETYILWQDRSGGRNRIVFMRPDLQVDAPSVSINNVVIGKPSNRTQLVFTWKAPDDSSSVSSHSWIWSRNPDDVPSRLNTDQVYMPVSSDRVNLADLVSSEDLDGRWYLSIIARDEAGNWSEPLQLTYLLDTKPPLPPLLNLPATDSSGYLLSNTLGMSWEDAEKEAADAYRWRLDWLGSLTDLIEGRIDLSSEDAISYDQDLQSYRDGADFAESEDRGTVWPNLDNGVWAFSVASKDLAGNISLSSTTVLLARRYIPVTYITGVTARKDASDRTILRIIGRGFSVGGNLTHGIVDRDGKAPWDYEYSAEREQIGVYSDGIAEIIGIEGMEEGVYYIGVRHPVRGDVFWDRQMKLDAGGNVKFGPFGLYAYESLWEPAARLFRLSGNELLLTMLLLMAVSAIVISVFRLLSILRESGKIKDNARAIFAREPLTAAARIQAVAAIRSKGMRLRSKFMLWFILMVMITILIISVVLGYVWIRMERDSLAQGLESESRLMVETLASTAATSIPAADRGTLLLLPDRINALPDAMWTSVSGPLGEISNGRLRATTNGSEYVWASNDPDVLDKLELPKSLSSRDVSTIQSNAEPSEQVIFQSSYVLQTDGNSILDEELGRENQPLLASILRRVGLMPSETGQGFYQISDDLSRDIEILRNEVEQEIQDAGIERMIIDLLRLEDELEAETDRIISTTFDFDDLDFLQASDAVDAQKREIESLLLEVSTGRFASYPKFSSDSLRDKNSEYFIFYKPILYRSGTQDVNFFRGIVRLAVSIEDIRDQLALVQRRIIIITIVISIVALAMSLVAALGISSIVVRPITELVAKVGQIQAERDKTKLENFVSGVKSNDELGILGDTIDTMVQGLVEGAKEQVELMAGQGIQKTFLTTLYKAKDKNENEVTLSTGGDSNPFFQLFGYYEGADAVSGDYFGYYPLDEDHRAMMKLDISGHGVTASMIMVQAASLFVDYFRKIKNIVSGGGRLEYSLSEYSFGLNDLMIDIAFQGRFAAYNLSVINVRTGEYQMTHAGDNIVNIYDPKTGKMRREDLVEAPACGQISSDLIEMQNISRKPNEAKMYEPVHRKLERGEILFLYTDGIEESQHLLRNEKFERVRYSFFSEDIINDDKERFVSGQGYEPILNSALEEDLKRRAAQPESGDGKNKITDEEDPFWEDFERKRINDIIESVMHRQDYILERRLDLTIGKPLHFEFSKLEPNAENSVLALASVERVFRLVPDPNAGSIVRTKVDRKIDDFLKKCFTEYSDFFHHPVETESDVDYVYFSHLLSDPQVDDLTIWAYERL